MSIQTIGADAGETQRDAAWLYAEPLTNPAKGHLVPALLALAITLACVAVTWLIAPYR